MPPVDAMKRIALFPFLWLAIGFSIGTATLLGPVHWVTGFCRGNGFSETIEQAAVLALIALLVSLTGVTAFVLAGVVLRSRRADVRFGIPLLVLVAAGGAVWLWMTPAMLRAQGAGETTVGPRFTFGPYPDEERLRALRQEGYTAVVSLLHPAVIPFEPRLLAREKQAAARAGIELLHLPMLPWVSENSEALSKVRQIARSGRGRYYVHCYLGMDRVQLVRRVVEEETGGAGVETPAAAALLPDWDLFERGPILHLDPRVHVVPFPTDEEFLRFFAGNGDLGLVSLLDDKDREDRPWIEKEQGLCTRYALPCWHLPLSHDSYDAESVLAAAATVRGLSGTVAVHDWLAPASGKAAVAEAFAIAYRTGRPPLPPSLFREPLRAGPAKVIAPHVASGPRPAPAEFGAVLARRGVREVIALGDPDSLAAREDRRAIAEARVRWRAWPPERAGEVVTLMENGGPFYLYAVGAAGARALGAARAAVAKRFGPPLPPRSTSDAETLFAARSGGARRGVTAVDGDSSGKAGGAASSTGRVRSLLEEALPAPKMIILLGPFLLLFAGGAAAGAGWMRIAKGLPVAYTRKTFHFAVFTMAGLLHIIRGLPAVMLFGGLVSLLVLYAVMRGAGFPFYEALARPSDAPHRTLFVLVPLATTALGGLLANLFFGGWAVIGYLVGGWGDAAGEPVGTAWGKHRYRVPSLAGVVAVRSLEGSAAVLVAGTLAAFAALLARGVPPLHAAGVAGACGLIGTVAEAFSTRGLDNLTVQLAASGAAFALLS